MPADCDYSSSGDSGSEGSLGRSQEDNGYFLLQKRTVDEPSGHTEGSGMFASTPVATGHVANEKQTMLTPGIHIGMEYWGGPMVATGHEVLKPHYGLPSAAGAMPYNGASSEGKATGAVWSQDDREQKREKRKQANRESARRSRMRKQFEYEDLAEKVASLTAENDSLKQEVTRLGDLYQKLSDEKSALLERVQKVQS